MLEVVVEGIRVNLTNQKRVLMLREKDGARYLPIWVGHYEADQVAIVTQNVPVSRPLTHDFTVAAIDEMGGKLLRVAITHLKDETYYASVVVEQDGRQLELDARPGDAVSLALRAGAPILADESLPFIELSDPGQIGSGDGAATLHQQLVDQLKEKGDIRSPGVEAAFRAVPRHPFLPHEAPESVYSNSTVAIKTVYGRTVSTSSQPSIMAIMLEDLDLGPGQRVLEIGAGTGYNAALMAHVVGEAGRVVTVDIDEELVEHARQHLEAVGLGPARVAAVVADGVAGYPEAAPFDGIMVTVGVWDVAPAWWEQLRPGGRLVLPLSIGAADCVVAFEPRDGYLGSVAVRPGGFVPLRGPSAGPRTRVQLGPNPARYVETETPELVDGEAVRTLLAGQHQDRPTGLRVTRDEVTDGLLLWLAAHELELAILVGTGSGRAAIPYLFETPLTAGWRRSACVLIGSGALAALTRPPDPPATAEQPTADAPFDLLVRGFGPGDALADRLIERSAAWDAAGRPNTDRMRIRAYPAGTGYEPMPGEAVVRKRWTELVLDWETGGGSQESGIFTPDP